MSLNSPSLPVALVLDPRINFESSQRQYAALRGSQINSWQTFASTNQNNNTVQITCNPPSADTLISRIVFKRFSFTVNITGTNTGLSPLLVPGYYGPRQFPIMSITTSENVTFQNWGATQTNLGQYWPALMWYNNEYDNRNGQFSLAPSMLDQFQTYAEGGLSPRNPLGQYGDNPYETARGGYVGMTVTANTSTSAQIVLTVTEPILLSPLSAGKYSNYTSCLGGLQSMSYNASFGDLSRVVSLDQSQGSPGVINITNVAVSVDTCQLLFNYLSPNPSFPIPRQIESSYFSITSYPTRTSALIPPGGNVSIVMQSIQVAQVPRRVYFFARRDDSLRTAYTADTYFALPSAGTVPGSSPSPPLQVVWNNSQLLSQATTQDLYNMSVKNGISMSFTQFSSHVGSVVCIDFGTDLSLVDNYLAPGSSGNFQFSLTCNFINTHPTESIAPTLYVVVVSEGVMNITNGTVSANLGVLNHEDVLGAKPVPGITYKRIENIYGGDFFSNLKSALGTANRFLKDNRVVSTALGAFQHPVAQGLSQVARQIGYGGRHRMRRMRGGGVNEEEQDEENRIDLRQLLSERN